MTMLCLELDGPKCPLDALHAGDILFTGVHINDPLEVIKCVLNACSYRQTPLEQSSNMSVWVTEL